MEKSTNDPCSGEFGGAGDMPPDISQISTKFRSDPELENFLKTVNGISNVVQGLASNDPKENERALRQADILLFEKDLGDVTDPESVQCTVTQESSHINKIPEREKDGAGEGDMSQETFMRMVEKDAKERAENRKLRKKESDEFRKKGNILFGKKDYAGALYNYNEAIKLIKDSPCLYNNRALTFLRLKIYSSAVEDCDKALELEAFSLRARMYKAKALFLSGEAEICRQELRRAREQLPGHVEMIDEYETEIFNMGRSEPPNREDIFSEQEKKWNDAANFKGIFSAKSNETSQSRKN